MRKLFSIVILTLAVGCASNQLDHFDKLREGMDKDAVLSILGNPTRTEKAAVEEKWCYTYYTGDNKENQEFKYVRFINGRVTAFGEDTEEVKRLQILKDITEKRDAQRKKKAEIEEKIEKAYQQEREKKTQPTEEAEE